MSTNAIFALSAVLAAPQTAALQQHVPHTSIMSQPGGFGSDTCQCVGISGLGGNTTVTLDGTAVPDLYPTDLGSSCLAWDEGKFPGMCNTSTPEDWCSQPWCYVDFGNCVVETGPYESSYYTNGAFRGNSLYYSYVTCEGTNTYDSLKKQSSKSEWPWSKRKKTTETEAVPDMYGLSECQCIGIEGIEGNLTGVVNGTEVTDLYPADVGSSCTAWDEGKYPGSCDTNSPEDWCSQPWCYVDQTNCVVSDGPYETEVLPNATFHGAVLYYSYVACGGQNTYNN